MRKAGSQAGATIGAASAMAGAVVVSIVAANLFWAGYGRTGQALTAGSILLALAALGWASHSLRVAASAEEARRQLAETRAQELERFAGRVSHDLKSPLASTLLLLGAVERQWPHPTLATVRGELRNMGRLIDGLLDFALAGATVEDGYADLDEVLGDLLPALRVEAHAAGAELVAPLRAPLAVACPGGAFASVVSNLVINAIKYTSGAAERRIEVCAAAAGAWVRIEVVDSGPGIPLGREQEIFEPLVRLPGAPQPGFGLGLATVRRIVQGCGGRVGVHPGPSGRGACFWFELPAAEPRCVRASA
jgi:signal transduction histidine kinase